MPQAVVFDMDGLLFDSERLYLEAAITAAAEIGHDAGVEVYHRTIGVSWARNREVLLEHFGPAFPVDDFITVWLQHFGAIAAARLALKPGVVELLDLLAELHLPKAIATSSSHATVQSHLAAHDPVGRFDAIVGAGDYAGGKPAPDSFLAAAARLAVAPEACLALEDSHNGVRSASAAGMMTVMVPDLLPATAEIRALCSLVVADLHTVRKLVIDAPRRLLISPYSRVTVGWIAGTFRTSCRGGSSIAFSHLAMEELNIVGLARGMLAKSVHNAAWAQLVQRVRYKAESAGVEVRLVDPRRTSQTCPECGTITPKTLAQREHRCECGCVLDRDVAAARVVLHRAAFRPGTGLQAQSGRSAAQLA